MKLYSTGREKTIIKRTSFWPLFGLFLDFWITFGLFLLFLGNIFDEFFSVFLILSRFISNPDA